LFSFEMEEEPTARRFALKYDPPTVILEYRTSEGLFHYRMRIKNLTSQMDPDDVTKALFEHHPRYLDVNKVKFSQVRRLVEQLMRKLAPDARHATGATSPPTQQTETTTPARLDPRLQFTEDLNKVSEVRERETHGANARTTPRVLRGTRCAMGARARGIAVPAGGREGPDGDRLRGEPRGRGRPKLRVGQARRLRARR
jgi:hypothetical protein